ncbi:hypothetical protein [uncultured Maribacter sp.]|uniref:hypothetical protein n=1 Tax=uncultured Maribacter sp. TaxID=431308 RepID=UPI002613C9D3|nr:hypothetical protein [uncultured Maribacter sp.]
MKKISLLFLCITMPIVSIAQSSKNVEDNQFKINFLAPALNYEVGIQKNSTLSFELGTGFAIRGGSEVGTDFGFYPYLDGQYNYYYNLNRRIAKGKNIALNTGNYVAIKTSYYSGNSILGDLDGNNYFFAGPIYGLQRTYKSGFNFELAGGVGYYKNDVDGGVSIEIDLSIGWVLFKKKNK